MFEFIKNNKAVFGILFIGVFLVLLIFITILTTGKNSAVVSEEGQDFANTDEERVFDPENDGVFGPYDEKWLASDDAGKEAPDFRAITKSPVAGAVAFERFVDGDTLPYVRYRALSDGRIYETTLRTVGEENKLTDANTHRIGDMEWGSTGGVTLERFYDKTNTTVQSYLGRFVQGSSSENTLEFSSEPLEYTGRQLDIGIQDATFSPDGSKVFYLVKTENGVTGYLEAVETGTKAEVWSSVLRGLTVSWTAPNMILVYTNPSSVAEGAVWVINPSTGSSYVILANEKALAVQASPTGEKILYSIQESKGDAFSLRMLEVETGEVTVLPVETIVDKCVWSNTVPNDVYCAVPRKSVGGKVLEEWYMGIHQFDDQVWKINVESGTTELLLDPHNETGDTFDIVDMSVSPEDDYLVFRSRVNNALWSLKLAEEVVAPADEMIEGATEEL